MPSKKMILVLIACIVAVVLVYIASRESDTQAQKEAPRQKVAAQIVVDKTIVGTSSIDSDKDGLMDWEEVLWQTDPHLEDTDNDGTSDKKEIELKQSAQTEQSKAQVAGTEKTSSSAAPATEKDLTLTDKLARETFAQYVNLKQTGVPLNPAYIQDLVQSVLGKDPFNQNIPQFASVNLPNITDNADEETLREYGNELWSVMVRNTPQNITLENEYVILLTAIQKQDEKELLRLDPIALGYRNTIMELIAMKVPRGAVAVHLDLINNMNSILALVEDMKVYFTDSLRGFGALTLYKQKVPMLHKSIEALAKYFEEKGVVYVEGEGGYTLVHSI